MMLLTAIGLFTGNIVSDVIDGYWTIYWEYRK